MTAKSHPLLGRRLLLLTAHPDDETFAAGTIWANHQAAGQTALVCATLGEKGMSHLRRPISSAQLKKRRHRELLAAARLAGIASVRVLHLPDGEVAQATRALAKQSWSIIKRWKPEVILTFGPDGMTGHRDHVAAGRVARQLARRLGCAIFIFTLPVTLAQRAPGWFMKRRVNPHYQAFRPYAKPTLKIPIEPRRKHQIMWQHRSQLDASGPMGSLPAYARRQLLRYEYFAKMR